MSDAQKLTIVIDNGSDTIKIGFASEALPNVVVPTVVGTYRLPCPDSRAFIGDEVKPWRGLKLTNPIKYGDIVKWDEMETIWNHIFHDKLCVDSSEHPVLLTETPLSMRSSKDRMTEIMFEKFNVPALHIAIDAELSLIASGRETGIVCDAGDGVINVVPIIKGQSISSAIPQVLIAGCDLTDTLIGLLTKRGFSIATRAELATVRDIKEKFCCLTMDLKQEMAKNELIPLGDSYQLHDEQNITHIGNERFQCPDALFNHPCFGRDTSGIHEAINKSILKCDEHSRNELYANIILSGASTLFPGIVERLHKEVTAIVPPGTVVKVIAPSDRKYSVWIGGSKLASSLNFQQMLITKMEYDEIGLKQ